MKNNRLLYRIAPVLLLLAFACSTEKNTWMSRNYHSLTSHYNIYFNGNESLEKGLAKIDESIKNDYTKILPIFKESLPSTGDMVKSDMERAVEKASKVIKMHSITNKPKIKNRQSARYRRLSKKEEYNRWVDDSYILMGRAYLYQQDFIRAVSTFSYVIRRFKNDPIKYDAYVWLVRTYNEMESFSQSIELIEKLEGDEGFPEELEGELAIVTADFHLKQNHHEEAIHYLDLGIKKIKGNSRKTRYSFILAQLYQETGNNVLAIEAYKNVIRRRPDYGMVFNSRINSARAFSGEADVAELTRQLQKMLKRKKNKDYLDQIYYALANIALNEGDETKGIELLRLSSAASLENQYQKALSCITVADLYFKKNEYTLSQNYYDTAMAVIDENYPDFVNISVRYNSLSNLVNNLVTVETQDSLQKIANMEEEDRTKLIEGWMKEAQDEIDRIAALEASGNYTGSRYRTGRMRMGGGGSGFYFYNPATLSFGKKEFARLWGDRPAEDNWRRSDKTIGGFDDVEGEEGDNLLSELEAEEEIREEDPTKKEFYLQDVPLTDSLMALSHEKIKNALYNAARIFKTEFDDNRKSIDSYLSLNERYPDNEYRVGTYFDLWDLYNIIEKPDSAEYYKQLVISDFPDSKYAKYLINPNYFIELEAKNDRVNNLYKDAFIAFKYHDFDKVSRMTHQIMELEPTEEVIPKARFLMVVADNRLKNKQIFADSLKSYMQTYPADPAANYAKEILALIDEPKVDYKDKDKLIEAGYINNIIMNPELLPENDPTKDEFGGKFDYDEDLLHYFVIAYEKSAGIDANRLRFDIANYNIDNFTTLDFDIEFQQLGADKNMLIVRSFEDKEQALIYFLSIIRKSDVFVTIGDQPYVNFVISSNNFREMNADGSYDEYLKYFVRNYSRYTSDEFREEELESPEELMARLRAEEEKLEERGSYVVVAGEDETKPTNEEEAASKEIPDSKYSVDDNQAHQLIIFVEDNTYNIALLMRDFRRYNGLNKRSALSVSKVKLFQYQDAMVVKGFENAYDCKEYFDTAKGNRSLFRTVGTRSYRNFIISDDNYALVKDREDVAEYLNFYKPAYLYREISKPEPKVIPVEEKEVEEPKQEEKKEEVKPATTEKVQPQVEEEKQVVEPVEEVKSETKEQVSEVVDTIKKVEESTNLEETEESIEEVIEETVVETVEEEKDEVATENAIVEQVVEENTVEEDKEEDKTTLQDTIADANETVVSEEENIPESVTTTDEAESQPEVQEEVVEEPKEVLPEYDGPFVYNAGAAHSLVFVVPKEGFNSAILEAAIRRVNATKYKSLNLTIKKEGLDDFRNLIMVNGLPEKETAITYYKSIMAESRTRLALRNTQYRDFLITQENLDLLKKDKNLTAYLDFFKLFYNVK